MVRLHCFFVCLIKRNKKNLHTYTSLSAHAIMLKCKCSIQHLYIVNKIIFDFVFFLFKCFLFLSVFVCVYVLQYGFYRKNANHYTISTKNSVHSMICLVKKGVCIIFSFLLISFIRIKWYRAVQLKAHLRFAVKDVHSFSSFACLRICEYSIYVIVIFFIRLIYTHFFCFFILPLTMIWLI